MTWPEPSRPGCLGKEVKYRTHTKHKDRYQSLSLYFGHLEATFCYFNDRLQ